MIPSLDSMPQIAFRVIWIHPHICWASSSELRLSILGKKVIPDIMKMTILIDPDDVKLNVLVDRPFICVTAVSVVETPGCWGSVITP